MEFIANILYKILECIGGVVWTFFDKGCAVSAFGCFINFCVIMMLISNVALTIIFMDEGTSGVGKVRKIIGKIFVYISSVPTCFGIISSICFAVGGNFEGSVGMRGLFIHM